MNDEDKNRSNIYKGKIGEPELIKVPKNSQHGTNIYKGEIGEPELIKVPINLHHRKNIYKERIRKRQPLTNTNHKEFIIPSATSIINEAYIDELGSDPNLEELKNENRKIILNKKVMMINKKTKENDSFPLVINKGESLVYEFLNLHFPLLLKKGFFLNWEYVCFICSKTYISQNSIPTKYYIKGMEKLIFIPLSKFNDIFEKWIYQKYEKSSDTLIEELGLKQFSKKTHKVSEGYLAKPLPIDFEKLIKPFINSLARYLNKKNMKEHSNMRYGGTHPDLTLAEIYSNRKKHKWFGIIYKITQIKDLNMNPTSDGLIQIGFTTDRFSSRWFWYQTDAFNHNKELDIYQLMRDFENIADEDLKKVSKLSKNGIGYIGKNKIFTWEILEICWSDAKLRAREKVWIRKFKREFNDRVGNIDKGGGGGTKIVISPVLLIPLIARGYWSPKIAEILEKEHGIICSKDVVIKRINEFWGSIDNARVLFIKPILKILMSQGYSATYLSNIFSHETGQGVSRLTKTFWDEDFKIKRLEFIKKHLITLFRKGYETYEMDSKLRGVPWETVRKEYIKQWWGTSKDALITIVKPVISEMLSRGFNLKRIAISLEHDSIDRLKKQISVCWGFEQSICFWVKILNFLKYIKFKKLTSTEIYNLNYDSMKEDLKRLKYLKFLTEYKKNPNMNLSMFKSLFPDMAHSSFYHWKEKAKKEN
ncbi:MAG: hypothetical protein ACFFAN_18940 [Promethearchaeota archaeon]